MHEKNLRLQFSNFDKNKDGKVDMGEMIAAFKELGIKMDYTEALKLFNRYIIQFCLFFRITWSVAQTIFSDDYQINLLTII